MATILCVPQSFTVSSASEQATAQASNAGTVPAGLVWRSNGLSSVFAVLQTAGPPIDLVSLAGTNLRAGDSVRVRGASTAAMTSPLFDVTLAAWSGVSPVRGALTLVQLAATYTAAFVRIDITSTGNPAGYVEVQRIVMGKKVSCDGVDIGCEQGFDDTSTLEEALGDTIVDQQRVRDTWKATVSNVREQEWYTNWYPFLRGVGSNGDFLFVPETDPTYMQNQAIMGRISSKATGSYKSSDFIVIDLNIKQV
jgi:hypothetical protein